MFSCGRCSGTGFLNFEQIPDSEIEAMSGEGDWHDRVIEWIERNTSDVQVCDCCGNGESWKSDCPGYHDDDESVIECL